LTLLLRRHQGLQPADIQL